MLAIVAVAAIAGGLVAFADMNVLRAVRNNDERAAAAKADRALADFDSQLADDPDFFLGQVDVDERARICVTATPATVVEPGELWPAACGPVWDYDRSSVVTGDVVLEVLPPGLGRSKLVVSAAAHDSGRWAGRQVTYSASGGRWALWSDAPLTLDTSGSGRVVKVAGGVSAPSFQVPTGAQTQFESVAVSGAMTGAGTYRSDKVAAEFPGDTRASADTLRVQIAQTIELACADSATPSNLDGFGVRPAGVSALCLQPGATVRAADDTLVAVPPDITGMLLLPDGDQIDVYTTTLAGVFQPATTGGYWNSRSTYWEAIYAQYNAGIHPSSIVPTKTPWTLLGAFRLPLNGVIATGVDTQLGVCSAPGGYGASSGAGVPWTVGHPDRPTCDRLIAPAETVTVIAGTLDAPRDLLVGASTDVNWPLTLVATNDIVVPYWAMPRGTGDLHVDAILISAGDGPGVTSYPVAFTNGTWTSSGDGADHGWVTLAGGVRAPNLNMTMTAFDRVTVSAPRDARTGPWAPDVAPEWERVTVRELAPAEARTLHEQHLSDS